MDEKVEQPFQSDTVKTADEIEELKVAQVTIYDAKQTKSLLRKLDRHLIPFLSLLYLLSFLDRTNIGNAKLFGLEASLGLVNQQVGRPLVYSAMFSLCHSITLLSPSSSLPMSSSKFPPT